MQLTLKFPFVSAIEKKVLELIGYQLQEAQTE